MHDIHTAQAIPQSQSIEINKVLRNTYLLLALTLIFSAVTAGVSMAANLTHGAGLVCSLVALGLIWFVLPRTANSSTGLLVVFAFTGLIGAGMGPMINHYLNTPNGSNIVLQALGGTAFIFLGLSGYTLFTRKDFSFLQGFVAMGLMLMLGCIIALFAANLMGFHLPLLSLAFSAGVVLLMSALILYQTSEIIHGGERNYLLATTSLYLSIINLFTSLLHLLGFADD